MFIDEIIEDAYLKDGITGAAKAVVNALPKDANINDYKHVNYAWKAFARKHSDVIDPDGFKNLLLHLAPQYEEEIKQMLK